MQTYFFGFKHKNTNLTSNAHSSCSTGSDPDYCLYPIQVLQGRLEEIFPRDIMEVTLKSIECCLLASGCEKNQFSIPFSVLTGCQPELFVVLLRRYMCDDHYIFSEENIL